MCKDRYNPMNHTTLWHVPAPHRWTAASVGADRYRAAIGPLSVRNPKIPHLPRKIRPLHNLHTLRRSRRPLCHLARLIFSPLGF